MNVLTVGAGRPAQKVAIPAQVAPGRGGGPEKMAPLWVRVIRFVVRHKWQHAPVLLLVAAPLAAADRGTSAGQLAVIALGLGLLSHPWRPGFHARLRSVPRGDRALRGSRPRHVLPWSLTERRHAALGIGGVIVWLGITVTPMPWLLSLTVLVALIGWPSWEWVNSPLRNTARPKRLSKWAKSVVTAWGENIATSGPNPLLGSTPIRHGIEELTAGGMKFEVLLSNSHPNKAVMESIRQDVEFMLAKAPMKCPVDSVELSVARDDGGADRIIVTITPTRHLELTATVWQGPVLNRDGSMPIAESLDGSIAHVNLHNDSGVESGLISGASDSGKSNSGTVVVAPGILAGKEIMIYLDGGNGSSNPLMRQMATIDATDLNQWEMAINIFHAIAESRKERWAKTGEFGRNKYQFGTDPEPVVTLFLEEATQLRSALSRESRQRVADLQLIVRKLGMRIIQSMQSLRSDQFIGDAVTRSQAAANGFIIAHAVGSPQDAASSTTGIPIPGIASALGKVPATPGMALISRRKQIVSQCARVFFTETDLEELLTVRSAEGWRPLRFTGADLVAAESVGLGQAADQPMIHPVATRSKENENLMKIYFFLDANPDGLTSRQIIGLSKIPDSTVYRLLKQMGDVIKDGDIYRLADATEGEAA